MKRISLLVGLLALGLGVTSARAEKWEESRPQEQHLFWRNSLFTYEHVFSALSLDPGADLSYDPYYAQSLSFRPRVYLRDDLSIRPRLDLEIELTTSNSTDHAREWELSDFSLDTVWTPEWMTIPVVGVKVHPSLRLVFPTSIVSRGRSMVMMIGPGFSLRRQFQLAKGKWFTSLDVGYGFRLNKYFHNYAVAQLGDREGCANINRPECQHRGTQNKSWVFSNSLDATVQIFDRLSFSAALLFYNNLLHELPAYQATEIPGQPEFPASPVNHTASTWAIFEFSYDLFAWLSLSAGTSTFYGQLNSDSSYNTPFFNRYTNFFFDVTIPVDAFYTQIKTWTGKGGSRRRPSAEMKGAKGLLATGY